jgi:magnesium-transporting ATPase (P-type)
LLSTLLFLGAGRHLYWEDDVGTISAFIMFVLLYNNIIPISLFIVLDMIRFAQMFFIQSDLSMLNEENNVGPICKMENINDDLGQVEYIFTEKNGILSQNSFISRSIAIEDRLYEFDREEVYSPSGKASKPIKALDQSINRLSELDRSNDFGGDLSQTRLHDASKLQNTEEQKHGDVIKQAMEAPHLRIKFLKAFEVMTLCN